MRELLIARHGQAGCNLTGTIAGESTCTGLTDLGRAQARALAHRLQSDARDKGNPITAIYTSPRRRAHETAQIIADALGVPPHCAEDLREPDYGPAAEGRTWADLLAAFPGETSARPDLPLARDGEPWTAYIARITGALARLHAAHPGGRVLITGHAETVKAAYQIFLGHLANQPLAMKFSVANASLTTWQAVGSAQNARSVGRWVLISHNDIWHLTGLPRSTVVTH